MEYGIGCKVTPVPVELVEAKEGLVKITTFEELVPFTLRALLKGYHCTEEMLDRMEEQASFIGIKDAPIEFFVTYNPHTFAACVTNINNNFYLGKGHDILEQSEILDLVESLPGSLVRPGVYHCLKRMSHKTIHVQKLNYEYPIFDMALRYLCLFKQTQVINEIKSERYLMVLYMPQETK